MNKKKFPGVGAAFAGNTSTSQLLNDVSKSLATKSEKIVWLPAEQVKPNPQEKVIYDLDSLDEITAKEVLDELDALARDIVERGITSPLSVISTGTDEYMVTSGHRRRLANEIAVEKYGYEKGAFLPCTIHPAPVAGREFEVTEALILDNLQREKSDYNRMMEIITFWEATKARKAAGERIPSVRERVKQRLGVSDTEMTRYDKIYHALDDELMEAFRKRLIASTVAYEVAKLDEEYQKFIAQNWDRANSLTLAFMNAYVAEYNRTKSTNDNIEDGHAQEKPVTPKIEVPVPTSFVEGVEMLNKAVDNIKSTLSSDASEKMDRKLQNKILKKLSRQMVHLIALQNELALLGLTKVDGDGE